MENTFVSILPEQIAENAVKLIGLDWMLITAGTRESYNMMTASWGGLGYLWQRPVAYIFIRPQRYTRQFVDQNDKFTLTFFDEGCRGLLDLCGSKSGRDIAKMSIAGLTPRETASGAIYFAEAKLVIECRKIYHQEITPDNFLATDINDFYPDKDYHRMYVGQITECLAAK
jgi:flavin reductase (DIM6/NTAB) family NADH-FMN oxidoreductase RutF